ncbi:MAG: O-antigen ligase family protein [Abditibacteriota bacterium]|nr:O-antigen ligase family protein [Abditibacteriota bacterium]
MKRTKKAAPESKTDLAAVSLLLIPLSVALSPFMAGNMNFYAVAIPLYLAALGVYIYFGNKQVSDGAEFPPYLLWSFGAALVFSLASMLFWSADRYLSAVSVISFVTLTAVAVLMSLVAGKKNIALYTALGLFGGAALCSVRAVAQALAMDGARLFAGGVPRIFGGFVNPNFFAGYLTLVIPVGIALFFAFTHKTVRLLLAVGLFFTLGALFLTGSKFGLVGLLAGLAALVFMLRRVTIGKKDLAVTALLIAAAFGLFGMGLMGRVANASGGGSESHSAEFRLYTWRSAADMCLDNPWLGVGPGRFEEAYPRYTVAGLTSHAHNSFLQFADEYGIPCSVLAGAWLLCMLYGAFGSARHPDRLFVTELGECSPQASVFLAGGLTAGVCGLLCHSLADSDLYIGATGLSFAVCAGILLSLAPRRVPAPGYLKSILARCVLLSMLVVFVFGLGDWFVHTGRYESALRMVPINSAAWIGYARDTESASMARTRLKNAVREAPESYQPYMQLADLANAEDPGCPEAVKLYEQALRYHPNSLIAMKKLAEIGVAKGDNKLADRYYGRLLTVEKTPYEKVKGVPEMVNTSYCDAHMYFADKALMENDLRAGKEHARAACDRYARWLDNRDYIIICLVNGMLTPGELEEGKEKYLEAVTLLGDLEDRDTSGTRDEIDSRVKDILKEYESVTS